jgi:hypothetical protein
MKVEAAGFVDQLEHGGLSEKTPPPGALRMTDHDVPNSVGAREIEKRRYRLVGLEPEDFGSEIPCPLFVFEKVSLRFGGDPMMGFFLGVDMDDEPIRV